MGLNIIKLTSTFQNVAKTGIFAANFGEMINLLNSNRKYFMGDSPQGIYP